MTVLRRKRLQDGSFGELEKVFEGETEQEKTERIGEETEILKDMNLNLMLANIEMYEEQHEKSLDLMLALTDLYEMVFVNDLPEEPVEEEE